MNAVLVLAGALPARAKLRRAARSYELDLVGFLNAATPAELAAFCRFARLPEGNPAAMRQRLWAWGAALERRDVLVEVTPRVQPVPVVAGSRLERPRIGRPATRGDPAAVAALPTARSARFPASEVLPRAVPPPREVAAFASEPGSLEELLARADALVGVRLGARPRDKGYYGRRVGELLGLPASSSPEPDWRGEVEVKTIAVARGLGGLWRIQDSPAVSMRSVDARAKMRRVLWIVRVDEKDLPGAPVLSWYFQELDPELRHAFERARHLRPKGSAGTAARAFYLRREFFAECGLLRSLNG